jgi:glycosyltransferase involved in cell wall biosynthesis
VTLRILYLIETLGHGGAEHQLAATIRLLDRSRFEAIVCHFRPPDYLAEQLSSQGIRVVQLNVPAGKQHWPELALRIRSLARELRVDLIHTSLLEADVLGGIAGRLAGIPVVSTLCNIAGDPIRLADNPRNSRLKFALTNLIWGGALRALHRHSIAISNAVRSSAVSTFKMDPTRISVIHRGIADERVAGHAHPAQARERLGLENARPFFLSVGRLAPQKGHKYLLSAFAEVVREFPEARLAVVGEGWLRPALQQQADELGIAKHVALLGKRTDVADLMAACDAFVFPSLFEGLGVALLEASYAGCACIATNTGPIPEIITDGSTGLLVPAMDSEALARAMLAIARDRSLAAKLGAAASENARRRFRLTDKVNELEAFYARLSPTL